MKLLEKFILLVDDYKKLTDNYIVIDKSTKLEKLSYSELVLKITLLRKFMMKEEKVYLPLILKEIRNTNICTLSKIDSLEKEVNNLFNLKITYTLSNTKAQHLYHSITDMLYGLYLHSETEKLENTLLSNENIRRQLLIMFISKFEPLLYKAHKLITDNIKIENVKKNNYAYPIIHYAKKQQLKRNVKKSPMWKNINGSDMSQKETQELIRKMHKKELRIIYLIQVFINRMQNFDSLKNNANSLLSFNSPIRGKLEENIKWFKDNPNVAPSYTVRYSTNFKYAYVFLFKDVEHALVVNEKQLFTNVNCIRLKKKIFKDEYKIYNYVEKIPKYYYIKFKNELK